jgi:hypothetical protein
MNSYHRAGHDSLADRLPEYLAGILDILEPWIEKIQDRPADDPNHTPQSCARCPVCALITVVHGGRSALTERWSGQFSEALAVLRALLQEGLGHVDDTDDQPQSRASSTKSPTAFEPPTDDPPRTTAHTPEPAVTTPDPGEEARSPRKVQRITIAR